MREFEADEQMVKQEVEPSGQSQMRPRPAHESTLWQPIETAPKNGFDVILGHANSVWVDCWTEDDGDAFWMTCDQWTDPERPTHWMPLPSPPAPERMSQCDNCLSIVPASEIGIVAYSDNTQGDFCERCRGGE